MKLDIFCTILKSSIKGRTMTTALSVAEKVLRNFFKTGWMQGSEKRHAIVREDLMIGSTTIEESCSMSSIHTRLTDRFRFLALRIQQLRINHIFQNGRGRGMRFDFCSTPSPLSAFLASFHPGGMPGSASSAGISAAAGSSTTCITPYIETW